MARVLQMTRGNVSMARGIHCSLNYFDSSARPVSLYFEVYIYIIEDL